MPNINRIRVNNVKYNFGTQLYDDFTMRMYGKNTLYDLANGGGKSVLMLLLMQNLIPNCTLDDKQPIEKLFRSGCGNTTIHSLIEWKLDDGDIKEGLRYMTTGFCARKAKDSSDEAELGKPSETPKNLGPKTNAAIEYFNYCILYRDYNNNDIINLPLSNKDERITYTGLKNYLKDLGRKDLGLEVYVFERKGEYQRFISEYGLYESQWEIVRGINKTEGHVRTYFENNYKTTRKVVEDLLIEEIIEKAFYVKTEKDDGSDDMAKTLLDIKDKLVELSNKKRDINNFDRQMQLVDVLKSRVVSFLDIYNERSRLTGSLADIYETGKRYISDNEETLGKLNEALLVKQKEKTDKERSLESLKVLRDRFELIKKQDLITKQKSLIDSNKDELARRNEELKLKESINDYLDYLRDEKLKKDNLAIIKAYEGDEGSDRHEMETLAYNKHKLNVKKLEELNSELTKETSKLNEIIKQNEIDKNVLKEADIAYAVNEDKVLKAKEETKRLLSRVNILRQDINILVLSDVNNLLKEMVSNRDSAKETVEALRKSGQTDSEELSKNQYLRLNIKRDIEKKEFKLNKAIENMEIYRSNESKLKKMTKVYQADNREDLLDVINERFMEYVVDISIKNQELSKLKDRLAGLLEGRLINSSEAAKRVKDYIETRHGDRALLGMDYVSALNEVERENVLSIYPLLPYGVIAYKFKNLTLDNELLNLDLGNETVPVFDKDSLNVPVFGIEEEHMFFVQKTKDKFVDGKALEEEKDRINRKISELTAHIDRLKELGDTYKEDMDYVSRLTDSAFVNAEDSVNQLKEEIVELKALFEDTNSVIKNLTGKINKDSKELEEKYSEINALTESISNLKVISELSSSIDSLDDEINQCNKNMDLLKEKISKLHISIENSGVVIEGKKAKIADLESKIIFIDEEFKNIYSDYFVDGNYESLKLMEEDIDSRFKALKAVADKAQITMSDKKKLIETLNQSMDKCLRTIRKRGISIDVLDGLKESNDLVYNDEATLNNLSLNIATLSSNSAQLEGELNGYTRAYSKLEGSIEKSIKVIEERYEYFEDIDISDEETNAAIHEGDRVLSKLDAEYKEMEKQVKAFAKENSMMMDLYKDVKRIVETNDIDTSNAKILYSSKEDLNKLFEDSLNAYDKNIKSFDKVKVDLLNYKTHTANTLRDMNAYELSDTIANDVVIPSDYVEAKQLLVSLSDIIEFLKLEKDRVLKGIEDMEFIKTNFENQCIQRCQDVKTELDKLPALSRIILDGEPVNMISLTIPYVKEEFYQARMSEYINDVVSGADKYEDNEERMKYIRNRLVLKKLFSVIVTDMNSIKLNLYKRERIKEQSRYLRYEEAVGSTGQSQGIYIQFLVSIINYISGMYAPEADNEKLKKVIFIDNPFGAAKDVYIWEPIFALLKHNNVQLVVPARGATPAITNRFDVNYILGQVLTGGKQQTVVTDYRSQVEQEELEYKALDFEQASFDFI